MKNHSSELTTILERYTANRASGLVCSFWAANGDIDYQEEADKSGAYAEGCRDCFEIMAIAVGWHAQETADALFFAENKAISSALKEIQEEITRAGADISDYEVPASIESFINNKP